MPRLGMSLQAAGTLMMVFQAAASLSQLAFGRLAESRACPCVARKNSMSTSIRSRSRSASRVTQPEALSLDTKWIQSTLNRAGYKLDVDGDYGVKTHDAVKQFQAKHNLTVDGWVGPETIAELLKV